MARKVRQNEVEGGARAATAKAAIPAVVPAAGRKRVAVKRMASQPSRPAAPAVTGANAAAPAKATTGAKALIRAGLKALGDVRGDMVARQTRVFELLLGIGQSPAWTAGSADRPRSLVDPFGKFEDVFDQRVARSLERLGMPSPQVLQALAEQVKLLAESAGEADTRKRPKR